jgi:Prokaryotic RING finger family 1
MTMPAVSICPYCRSPVDSGDDAKECPSCGAAHHADCWTENDGCAVVGCEAGPAVKNASEIVLPPIEEPNTTVVVDVEAEQPREGKSRRRLVRPLIATTAVVVVVAVGIGAAVAIRAQDNSGKIEVAAETGPDIPVGTPRPARAASLPAKRESGEFTDAEVVAHAKQTLLRHHELLKKAAGDPSSPYARQAYALLSARKRATETAEGAEYGQSGFEFWITKREDENLRIGEAVCLPGTVTLQPPGYWNPRNSVAMVYADFGSYAGFTWVLYERGRWTYDAGYGHVPSREAIWEPRRDVLFQSTGAGC